MRTESYRPGPEDGKPGMVQVFAVSWDAPLRRKKKAGSCWMTRAAAVRIYEKKDALGLNPVLVDCWVSGIAVVF